MDGAQQREQSSERGRSNESSSESIVAISSDSWKHVRSMNDVERKMDKNSENSEKTRNLSSRSSPDFVENDFSSPARICWESDGEGPSTSYTSLDSKEAERISRDQHIFQSSVPTKRNFDATLKAAFEDRIVRPLQQIFYRKTVINENTSLVKHDAAADEEEIIMPQLPDSSVSCDKNIFGELPDGIGTGGRKKFSKSGYASIDDDEREERSKLASTYKDAVKGLAMSFLGAGVMYGLTAVFVRLAGQEGIDPVTVMLVRSIFQTFLFGSVLLFRHLGWRPPPGRAVRCTLISIAYCIASITSYEAFDVIPPGSAVATRGAARTIFSVIFAYLVLKEGVGFGDILGLFCCFGGIALIITSGMTSGDKDYIQPPGIGDDATTIRVYGYALLVVSAIGRSLGHVGVRGAKDDLNTFTVVFYHSFLTAVFAAVLVATVRQPTWPPNWSGVAYIAVICVASSIATFASNQAVKYAHPALVSFGQNADVVVSLTLEHILIRRSPRPMEIGGVLTIFIGLCGLTLYKWMKSKKYNGEHVRLK